MTAIAANGRTADRLILRTAARGAALIGAAVVLGIVLLQVVDNGGSPGSSNPNPPVTTGTNGSTSTTVAGQGRAPSEILVQVLNGSGAAGAAQNTSNTLRSKGYKVATPGNATVRTGNIVQCKSGYEKEANALAPVVGAGTTVDAFPNPQPAGTDPTVNCLVTLGK
jgi:hypothetical protein